MEENSENIECSRFYFKKCEFDELGKVVNDRIRISKQFVDF